MTGFAGVWAPRCSPMERSSTAGKTILRICFFIPLSLLANSEPNRYICRMNIELLTVGKTDVKWVKEGLDVYVARLQHYVQFKVTEIPELKKAQALSRDQIKEREGELILKHLQPQDTLILLDEHGIEYRSTEFAGMLEKYMLQGTKTLVFAVGGAYGFSPAVHARARAKMSLSKMTFTHQMVRTVFAEQLYRAFTILRGEPYHNE